MHRASDGRSPSPAQRAICGRMAELQRGQRAAMRSMSAKARSRAAPAVRAVSARIGSGSATASRRAGEPVVDDRRRHLGMELQPDAGPDGEGLQARGGARQLRGARREVEDVLVPGEPAPAVAVVALDVDPADLGLGARGSRVAPRAAASAWPPKQIPSTGTPAVVGRAQEGAPGRAIHGSLEACTERSEPSATTASARAGRAMRRPRARGARRPPRPGPRPSPPPARPARRAAAGRRAVAADYPFTRKAPRMNGWMRQK